MQVTRASAITFQLLFYVSIKSLCFFESIVMGKYGVGMFSSQFFSVIGCTGLEYNGPPLGCPTNI